MNEHLYAERDAISQGRHYTKHVEAMTAEALHSKSDIAAELAHRDIEIERLERCLSIANSNHEKFEREWYLRGDRIEELERELAEARAATDRIVSTYDAYRRRGVMPAPTEYRAVVDAIEAARRPTDQPAECVSGEMLDIPPFLRKWPDQPEGVS